MSALAIRSLGQGIARVKDGSHWLSVALGDGLSRLGGGQPIEEVVHLIFLHFHLLLTTSNVLQLLLIFVAPMWLKVGVLFVITYT